METIVNEDYESERKEMRKEDAFFGYEKSQPLSVDQELILLNDSIVDDSSVVSVLDNLPSDASEKYVRESIQLWEGLGINLHQVCSLRNSKEQARLTSDDFKKSNLVLVNPSEIPIVFNEFTDRELIESYLVQLQADCYAKDSLRRLIFHSVGITKLNDYLSACLYAHEIAHSQINSVYGSCKSRLNSETISALTEEMFAFNLDPSLKTNEQDRNMSLYFISQAITWLYEFPSSYSEQMIYSMYIQSYLESVNMANIYLLGNKKIKEEMQAFVSKIFDGERSVEDMLDHYDSNYKDVPKKLELIKKPFIK